MPPIALPLTVLTPEPVDLVIEATFPRSWGEVRAAVCAEAGLPAGTVLHHGFGPVPDDALLGSPPLLAGCELRVRPVDILPELPLLQVAVLSGPDAGMCVPVGAAPIGIGRAPDMTMRLTDSAASWQHAVLVPGPDGVLLRDTDSTNGVYVEGRPLGDAEVIPTGAVFRIGSSVMRLQLTMPVAPGGFVPDGLGHLLRAAPGSHPAAPALTLPPRPVAPTRRTRRALPWISAVLGGGVGVILALVLRHPLFLAFAALGPVTIVGTALGDRLRGRRSFRADQRAYRMDMAAWERNAADEARRYRHAMWSQWPGPAELQQIAECAGARLWSLRRTDADYLSVADGSGAAEPGDRPQRDDSPVADIPRITALAGVVGFAGVAGRGRARWVLAQLLALHSPQDLAVTMISTGPDLRCARDLLCDPGGLPTEKDVVIILDGAEALRQGAAAIAAAAASIRAPVGAGRVIVLCLVDDAADLPAGTRILAEHSSAASLSAASLGRLCRALMPLREPAATALPRQCTLSAALGPLHGAAVRHRWSQPSSAVTIGMGSHGPIGFDLVADGPHLLIAGTTGSGKSELLQTIITSLALAAPPTDLTMLLVDYKGGAAFGPLADLPHVVGIVTDLDPSLSARALASLHAELRRRERLVAECGPRPATLVIAIDEFATLAVELPDFLAGLLDIAQRGRSLGVHLILATQRPSGVVSPAMRANIPLRICLRVTDGADSRDVIGIPDAAGIAARTPGRAFIAAGTGTQLFQTARVTAPAPPSWSVRRRDATAIGPTGPTDAETVVAVTRELSAGLPDAIAPWAPPLPDRLTADEHADALALVDIPEEQRQETTPGPTSPLLVVGPARSGRSTALRRIATLAALRGEEVLVVDGATGLTDLAGWPAVSTYLDLRDPPLVLRLLALLADPSRQPSHIRHLVIDHVDLVSAAVERADYIAGSAALTNLLATAGETLRLTASGPGALAHGRLRDRFRHVLELGAAVPGRGRWQGHDVQLVDCPAEDPPPPAAGPSWRDRTVVRALPDQVDPAALPASAPHAIPIGIGGDDATLLAIDLAGSGGAILVTGPRRSGISSCLEVIADGAHRAGIPVWSLRLGGRPDPRWRDFDIRLGTEPLRAALAGLAGPVLLVADDAGAGHPAADLMERFLAGCGVGQYLLVGVSATVLARARSGFLAAAAGYRRGVLLSPDPSDGALFDIPVPRRTGPIAAGRGLWVSDGQGIPVQVAAPAHTPVTTPTPHIS